jgi:hypothetical protein
MLPDEYAALLNRFVFNNDLERHHKLFGRAICNALFRLSRPAMNRPSLLRLLMMVIGLAIGIATIAGRPPPDGHHKGVRPVSFVANY